MMQLIIPVLLICFVFCGSTVTGRSLHCPPDTVVVNCDTVPDLNREIVELTRKQIGKTVARGECWDLAALVLNTTGASWDKKYEYGRRVDPSRECIYPGDLMQFEGVQIKYQKGNAVYTETMAHHTAVISEVKARGVFMIAHQNTGAFGRKVGISELDLTTILKGKYYIYRPVR